MTYIYYPDYTFNKTTITPFPQPIPQPLTHIKISNLGASFRPVKIGNSAFHTIFILDDSSSMQSCKGATIEGFNGLLHKLLDNTKKDLKESFISLYKFDGSTVSCVYDHINIKDAQPIDNTVYNPYGNTNLFDGIGSVLIHVNNRLQTQPENSREAVTLVILTDGEENASNTFSISDIKTMVGKANEQFWTFMFLGANIDAYSTGASLGFNQHNTMQYNTKNMNSTITSAATMTTRVREAYTRGVHAEQGMGVLYASTGFTDSERISANE